MCSLRLPFQSRDDFYSSKKVDCRVFQITHPFEKLKENFTIFIYLGTYHDS